MATEMLTVEQIEALQVVALSSHPANKGWVAIRDTQLSALLAMAKAHLELVSALEFLREENFCCDSPDYREELHEADLVALARQRGWQSPTAKGGSNG